MSPAEDLRLVKLIGLCLALSTEADRPSFGACQRALGAPLARLAAVELAPAERRLVTELRHCTVVLNERSRPAARLRVRRALRAGLLPMLEAQMDPTPQEAA